MKKQQNKRQIMIDAFETFDYQVLSESQTKAYTNESAFQSLYANINNASRHPTILCVVEGRFSKNNAVSVNGRYYGDNFWNKQLEKEQTKYLLKKGLMYCLFGHVNRGIEDKDVEDGIVAGIVTHLQVITQPTEINGKHYEPGDLFGRAILLEMGGKNAGYSTYSLLSSGSQISISSRGLGEYIIGETYRTEDGVDIPIMNPDTYELETFDFTRLPGISDAEVHMVNDTQVDEHIDISTDENDEDEFTFESLTVKDSELQGINESLNNLIFNVNNKETNMANIDGAKLQSILEEANAKIAKLTAKLEDAEKERDDALAECDKMKDDLAKAQETVAASTAPEQPEENAPAEKADAEADAPTPEKAAEVDTTELEKFKAIAETPEELEATLIKVDETMKKCEDDAKELNDVKAKLEEAEEKLKDKEEECDKAEEVLESYVRLGSIQSLKAMVEANRKMKLEARKNAIAQFTQHYSNKKGITQESVKRIIDGSKSFKDAKRTLESLPNVNPNKGLWTGESSNKPVQTKSLSSFAESMINRMEERRNRNYTA